MSIAQTTDNKQPSGQYDRDWEFHYEDLERTPGRRWNRINFIPELDNPKSVRRPFKAADILHSY